MEYRRIGTSGLKVSVIGLGCGSATFAGRIDDKTSVGIIAHALELGINFIDTAETYAEGRSETLIGKAINGNRSQVVIATKFGKDRSVGPSEQPASRSRVLKAVEGSLRRLSTDYIDLYIMHEPDPHTPIEETLGALDDLVRSGKVRYIACADFESWQISNAVWTSRTHNFEHFVAASGHYNLLNRAVEREIAPCCISLGLGVIPTTPLGGGFLTGKYQPGTKPPEASRFGVPPPFSNPIHQDLRRYSEILSDTNFTMLTRLEEFARTRKRSVRDVAIAWLLAHPWLSTVPVGVTSREQLTSNVTAIDWKLNEIELAELNHISNKAIKA